MKLSAVRYVSLKVKDIGIVYAALKTTYDRFEDEGSRHGIRSVLKSIIAQTGIDPQELHDNVLVRARAKKH